MNYFAITFAVNAHSLCRFGLGLAFVQHQIDRALAQSHLSVVTKPTVGRLSLSEHQRELASRRLRLRQGRQRDTEQAHPFSRWQERFEQAEGQMLKVRETVDRVVDGLASGDLLKVGELHLQCHSPPSDAGRLAVPPDFSDDWLQRFTHRREFVQVLREGVLRPNRLADAAGMDRPFIDAARDPVIGATGLTEVLLKEGQGLRPQIEPRLDPEPMHFRSCCRSNAMEFGNRQILDECRSHFRGDDKEAIRLTVIGGKLRQEFVVADPGRGRQIVSCLIFARMSSAICVADAMPFRFKVTSR